MDDADPLCADSNRASRVPGGKGWGRKARWDLWFRMVSSAGGSESGRGRPDDWPSRYRASASEEKVAFMMV